MHGISEVSCRGIYGLYPEYAKIATAGRMQNGDRLLRREDTVQIGCCMKCVMPLLSQVYRGARALAIDRFIE
jgi:hypothetical protein